MSAFHYQAVSNYVGTDQHAVSQQAAQRYERVQAARERRAQRKAERQRRRTARASRESYTTAV